MSLVLIGPSYLLKGPWEKWKGLMTLCTLGIKFTLLTWCGCYYHLHGAGGTVKVTLVVSVGIRATTLLPLSPQSELAAKTSLTACTLPKLKMVGGEMVPFPCFWQHYCIVVKNIAFGVRKIWVKDQLHHLRACGFA